MRFLTTLTPLIVLILSFSQVYSQVCTGTTPFFVPDSNICVIDCPIGYYRSISGTQQVCLTQLPMKAVVHPTVEERVFILTFSHTPVPYSTEQELEDNVRLTMSSPTQPDTIVPVSASFLSETNSIVQITLPDNQTIPIQATFRMEFFNLRTNQDSQTAAIGPAIFYSLSSNQPSQDNDVVEALTRLDRGLEYTWITITTLNPYAFLYMNTKFYRETLEMFKRLNVQYGPIAARFLRSNNNKVSGFKAPNMFPILLMENEVTSGWNRYKENDMILENRDPQRVQDFEIAVATPVHYYDSTPLFLDNYGIQITVFFAVIVLIIIFEILNFVFRPKGGLSINSKARSLLQAVRIYLRWNLLIASVMGSYQSLIFYIIVQIQALSSEDDSLEHNTLNFWFAIASFIILALGFPIFILSKIISIEKKRRTNNAAFETEKEYYGIFFMFSNLDNFKSLTFIFALQVKAVVLATLTLLVYDHPVAQVATILCITIAFAIYIAILRPFSRLIYNIYQLGNELVLVAFLSTLLYNAHQNEDEILSTTEANASGDAIIAFWLLLPTLSIIFGLAGLIMRLKGISTQKPLKPFVPVVTATGQRQEEIALKKPTESQEHTEGNEKLSVRNQTDNYVRTPIAQGEALENYGHNLETVPSGQQTKEASFQKSVMSLPHLDVVDEEVEREQGSAETPVQYNKTVPNFYKTNSSQIMTPIRASSFDRGNGLNESRETIPEFRGMIALPKLSTSRDSRRNSRRESHRDSPVMLEIPDADITQLSHRSQRRPMSNSVSFDRESMERRRSVDMEKGRGSAMFAHGSKSNNAQQNARPNRSCYLSPSNTVLDARMINRSYMSSMQTNRARFYEDGEGFKKFKERFTFDEL